MNVLNLLQSLHASCMPHLIIHHNIIVIHGLVCSMPIITIAIDIISYFEILDQLKSIPSFKVTLSGTSDSVNSFIISHHQIFLYDCGNEAYVWVGK